MNNIWNGLKYFFLFPLFSLLPPPFPYFLARRLSHVEYLFDQKRRNAVRKGILLYFPDHSLRGEVLNLTLRKYFEVIACDDLDAYLYSSPFSNFYLSRLKIEGHPNLKKALKIGPCILLSTHFGGGFWILPLLKSWGVSARFFSAEVRRENYPGQVSLYLYHWLRTLTVKQASGRKVLFKGKGKEEMRKALENGSCLIVLLDVPPFLVKERIEVVFLGKSASFPRGIVRIAKELELPILPFFSYLDQGKLRRIRFEEPVRVKDERECVEKLVRLIEREILQRPDHWHFWSVAEQFFIS